MRLDPDAVVLVLGRAPPAQPGQDLVGFREPLREHDPDRVSGLDPQLPHRRQAAVGHGGGDLTKVAADVVAALEGRPGGPAARVDLGEGIEDGRRPDAEPQVPGHQPEQVTGLERGRPGQQPGQQPQLRALRARPLGERDLAQGADDLADLQCAGWAGRPGRPGRGRGQQQLGRLAEVARLAHERGHLARVAAGHGRQRADGELLGQAEIYPGELRRDQPLAEVAHGRQQFGRGVGHQRRQPFRQRQPTAESLQVTVGLGHDQIPHTDAPFLF